MTEVPRAVELGYRIGLGWLLGRYRLLLTAGTPSGDDMVRAHLPFGWHRGTMWIGAAGDEPWAVALRRRSVATVQAAPGPLAVDAVATDDGFELVPTGQPAPPPLLPDLNWVWLVVGAGAVACALAIRRH